MTQVRLNHTGICRVHMNILSGLSCQEISDIQCYKVPAYLIDLWVIVGRSPCQLMEFEIHVHKFHSTSNVLFVFKRIIEVFCLFYLL